MIIDNNFVKESLTVDGKIRLETKEVFKLCKPSYSCNVRMAYVEKNGSLPDIHKYTPETIENSGIDYISYELDGQNIYSCFDGITFEEMVYILTYHNQHNREVNKTAVQRYAIEMLDSDWRPSAGSIRFSDNSKANALLDGQHRSLGYLVYCYCIMKAHPGIDPSELPRFNSQITLNVPPNAQAKMDTGAIRRYKAQHDLLVQRGETFADTVREHQMAAKIAEDDKVSDYKITGSKTTSERDNQKTITKYKNALALVDDWTEKDGHLLVINGKPRSFVSINTAIVKLADKNPALAEKFHHQFCSGKSDDSFPAGKNPAIALREYAEKNEDKAQGSKGQKLFHAAASKAIEKYVHQIPTDEIYEDDLVDRSGKATKINYSLDWSTI